MSLIILLIVLSNKSALTFKSVNWFSIARDANINVLANDDLSNGISCDIQHSTIEKILKLYLEKMLLYMKLIELSQIERMISLLMKNEIKSFMNGKDNLYL